MHCTKAKEIKEKNERRKKIFSFTSAIDRCEFTLAVKKTKFENSIVLDFVVSGIIHCISRLFQTKWPHVSVDPRHNFTSGSCNFSPPAFNRIWSIIDNTIKRSRGSAQFRNRKVSIASNNPINPNKP